MVHVYIIHLRCTAPSTDLYMANFLRHLAVFLEIRFYSTGTFGQKQEAQEWLFSVLLNLEKKALLLLWEGGEGREDRSKNKLDFLSYSCVIRAPL